MLVELSKGVVFEKNSGDDSEWNKGAGALNNNVLSDIIGKIVMANIFFLNYARNKNKKIVVFFDTHAILKIIQK